MLKALRIFLLTACAATLLQPALVRAENLEDLPPYKMLRSLQFVQDAVVLGDHSSVDMQKFMLGALDKRLRSADATTFDDPRNVDAALVYTMSGGNPDTLRYLASRDIEGNFDNRITDALQHYVDGRSALVVEGLTKAIPEYRNARIGPYLYLVLANTLAQQDPAKAMANYDWARLTSPGTNIEEAALRRSIALSARSGQADRGFRYSLSYARRFLTSPYASQFADVFVELAVDNFNDKTEGRIQEILGFMDRARQREVYLRIARRAAIRGMQTLAGLATERARALSDPGDAEPNALANLYSGLVGVPSTDIHKAMEDIAGIPDAELSPRDRALRRAATAIAEEVLRLPTSESLTQVSPPNVAEEKQAPQAEPQIAGSGSGDSPFAQPAAKAAAVPSQATQTEQAGSQNDPAFDTFLSAGRSKIDEIDSLLKEEQ